MKQKEVDLPTARDRLQKLAKLLKSNTWDQLDPKLQEVIERQIREEIKKWLVALFKDGDHARQSFKDYFEQFIDGEGSLSGALQHVIMNTELEDVLVDYAVDVAFDLFGGKSFSLIVKFIKGEEINWAKEAWYNRKLLFFLGKWLLTVGAPAAVTGGIAVHQNIMGFGDMFKKAWHGPQNPGLGTDAGVGAALNSVPQKLRNNVEWSVFEQGIKLDKKKPFMLQLMMTVKSLLSHVQDVQERQKLESRWKEIIEAFATERAHTSNNDSLNEAYKIKVNNPSTWPNYLHVGKVKDPSGNIVSLVVFMSNLQDQLKKEYLSP